MGHVPVKVVKERLVAAVATIFLYIAVSVFIVISFVEVLRVAADVGRQIISLHDKVLAAILATAFIPTGFIVFWGCRALVAQFHDLLRSVMKLAGISRIKSAAPETGGMHRRSHQG
jgi:hypothetical protein